MARIQVQSLTSRTRVRYGAESVSIARGEGIEFADEKLTREPVIVEPDDPGGVVVLLTADRLAHTDADELIREARLGGHPLVLSIEDVDELDLNEIRPLTQRATAEGVEIVIRVGGH
jgi:hypothetical protein